MIYRLVILILICLSANESQAQKSVDADEYERVKERLDYSKTKSILKTRRNPKPKKNDYEPSDMIWRDGIGGVLNIIAYVVLGLLVLFICYMIFSNIVINRKLNQNDEPKEVEEHIEKIDLESDFEKAMRDGNLKLALRIRFLKILQILSFKNEIDWRLEKTNRDYVNELRGSKYFDSFRHLSNVFEFVWYGDREIDQKLFDSCLIEFDRFKKFES